MTFWVACVFWIFPKAMAWIAKRSADSSRARDRGSLNLIVILWSSGITLCVPLYFLVPQAAIPWSGNTVFFVGIFAMLAGIVLRWYSASILGKYFTFDVAIQSGQNVIEARPHRYIGHPSYTGALLSVLGFGLVLGNWAGLTANFSCLVFASVSHSSGRSSVG